MMTQHSVCVCVLLGGRQSEGRRCDETETENLTQTSITYRCVMSHLERNASLARTLTHAYNPLTLCFYLCEDFLRYNVLPITLTITLTSQLTH